MFLENPCFIGLYEKISKGLKNVSGYGIQFVNDKKSKNRRHSGTTPGPSKKVDPRTLEKMDPIPKFTMMGKNSFLIIPRLLISNMTIVFQVQFQKYPNKAILIPNLFF